MGFPQVLAAKSTVQPGGCARRETMQFNCVRHMLHGSVNSRYARVQTII